jgi:hypothetical protein
LPQGVDMAQKRRKRSRWSNIALLWLIGWPVLFVGFSVTDAVEHSWTR